MKLPEWQERISEKIYLSITVLNLKNLFLPLILTQLVELRLKTCVILMLFILELVRVFSAQFVSDTFQLPYNVLYVSTYVINLSKTRLIGLSFCSSAPN